MCLIFQFKIDSFSFLFLWIEAQEKPVGIRFGFYLSCPTREKIQKELHFNDMD